MSQLQNTLSPCRLYSQFRTALVISAGKLAQGDNCAAIPDEEFCVTGIAAPDGTGGPEFVCPTANDGELRDRLYKQIVDMGQAGAVYVVPGEQIWQTAAIDERRDYPNASSFEFVIRAGPQWQPGSYVDSYVRIKDGTVAPLLLSLKHQRINSAM